MDIVEGIIRRRRRGEGVGVSGRSERSVDGCFASCGLANISSAIRKGSVKGEREMILIYALHLR